MARLMSVAFTEQAVRDRTKTVTRRKGWWRNKHGEPLLAPGDRLTLCRKVMGRRRQDGTVEPLVRICDVEVVAVTRERLGRLLDEDPWGDDPQGDPQVYARAEVAAEGFPGMAPEEFVDRFFVRAQGIYPDTEVTRIEWRYL